MTTRPAVALMPARSDFGSGDVRGQAAVASGHAQVSAAAELLRAGGNAFDAAVGAGFAAAIAEPALTSLGGGGFLLAHTAQGRSTLFDFFVDTPGRGGGAVGEPHFVPVTVKFPSSEQVFNVGLGSVATPGCLRGFLHVHRRLGRLPLAEVLAPAVALARDGLVMTELQAELLGMLGPIMTLTDPGRALYAPRGHMLATGERLANPALADFLEQLPAEGERPFYEGELARRIAADMAAQQGLLTAADLAGYQVIEREPLRADYRGHTLLSNPAPSFGGLLIALSLRLLEAAGPGGQPFGSPEHVQTLAGTLVEVSRRNAYLATALAPGAADPAVAARSFSRGTTHVSVCDRDGNIASMTTSNGEGSGYLAPGTGIMLNNMMGEDDLHPDGFHSAPPGQRVGSMMAPSLLLQDGRPRLALGSGGSKRIRTAILQVLSNVIDFDMDLAAAVNAPRLHWDGDALQVEPGFSAAALAGLAERWPVNPWDARNLYFGGVHAVTPAGASSGDPRRGGHALTLPE